MEKKSGSDTPSICTATVHWHRRKDEALQQKGRLQKGRLQKGRLQTKGTLSDKSLPLTHRRDSDQFIISEVFSFHPTLSSYYCGPRFLREQL
jgi:hypothetical protein